MKLDLYIPYDDHRYIGGPSTFLRNLGAYLESQNVRLSASPDEARNIFVPIKFNLRKLCHIHDMGGRIIQRLDGIWYPEKHGDGHHHRNQTVGEIYRYLADLVIFQSEYSRKQCLEIFGPLPPESYRIIVNGVDKNIFFPLESRTEKASGNPIRLITTGNFRDRAMIEPIVLALDCLRDRFSFVLDVVGPCPNKALETYFKREYVCYHGPKSLPAVAEFLREADIFLYSHLNPPCPNSVVEAVSSGLPVVGFDSGAMAELLPFGRDLLAPVSDAVFQAYADFDPALLAAKIAHAFENLPDLRHRAMAYSHLYSFEACGDAYLQAFREVLHQSRGRSEDSRLQRLLNTRVWRAGKTLAGRCSLDATARSMYAAEMSRWDVDKLHDYLTRICRARAESLPPSEAVRFLDACGSSLDQLKSCHKERGNMS